ncbi:MAG: hypothetical protein CM15mP74_12910 [Halieaceae bacterium]|nr:MAG: hypothetical protein CM15mP74_12910 [Halieaceae bacterium]
MPRESPSAPIRAGGWTVCNSSLASFEQLIADYLPLEQAQLVRRAYYYSEQAHYGQTRRSGEPYVTHPLAVASILARMHMDAQSLMAALLHDVIEDTGVNKEDIGAQFGEEVAELVDGVSKLTHVNSTRSSSGKQRIFKNDAGDGQGHSRHPRQAGRQAS